MQSRRLFLKLVLIALVLAAPTAWAQDGLNGALRRSSHRIGTLNLFVQEIAAGDFDNDQQPDGAVLSQGGLVNGQRAFRIEVHVTAGKNSVIDFSTPEGSVSLAALDVNRDGAPDLVVERAFTHERVRVYLNNGKGEFYTTSDKFQARDDSGPRLQAYPSSADFPMLFLPPVRGRELALSGTSLFLNQAPTALASVGPDALLMQCGARAPCEARAPPTTLFL